MSKLTDLAPGSVLGRYELVLRVASGGMGEVWAARIKGSRGFQKVVALKTLLPELSHNPNFEQMFLDEAALAARIKHPNVVQVIDLGEEEQVLFQVMEWVSGESLWGLMRAAAKHSGIPLDVAARIICQVCAGLHAAHELKNEEGASIGLVHRDISPQNILLTAQGIAKVVDFGVAKFAGRGVAATQVGELRGKVPYMAPEHIRGQELDRRADVFALGLLFYQLVSGEHPFLADNDQLTMARISSATPAPPLRQRAPAVSEELSRIVAAALEKSPAKRTPTAAEFMHQIERMIPDAGLQSTNDLVAEYLKEVVGDHIEQRDLELRDALKRLEGDGRGALPSSSREEPSHPNRRSVPPLASEGVSQPISGIFAAPEPAPMTPPLGTPPGVSAPASVAGAFESDDLLPPVTGWRASWVGRHPRIVAAVLIAAVGGGIVLLSAGEAPPDPATAAPSSSSVALAPSGGSMTIPASSPTGSSAPSSAASSASSASSASGSSSAATPFPPPGASVGASPIRPLPPVKGTARPREYTPGGL